MTIGRVVRSLARDAWDYPSLMFFAIAGSLFGLALGVRLVISAGGVADVILGALAIAASCVMCASYLYDASGLAPVGRHPSKSRRKYLVQAFLKNAWLVILLAVGGYSWFCGPR